MIDTSASMKGKKMGELNTVMEELIPEIRRVGEADTDVKIAVLTFSTDVKWMYSAPVSIEEFEWTRLNASGVTSMGAAFSEISSRMSRNGFLNSPSLSFAPVIFLMTDGYPSDDYKKGLKELQSYNKTFFRNTCSSERVVIIKIKSALSLCIHHITHNIYFLSLKE